jgi:hypothetical protein
MRLAIHLPLAAATVCAGLALSAPAAAQTYSPWSFGASIGTEADVSGDFTGPANSRSIALNTLNSNLSGNGILAMRGTSWDEVYDRATIATVEVRYATSEMSEFFGAISYTTAEAQQNVALGCLVVTGTTCQTALTGNATDFTQLGLEAGYRQWFGYSFFGDHVKPYFAVRGGLVRTDEIRLQVSAGSAGGIGNWRLYDEGWTAMIGADLGATVAISQNAEIGGEIGVRYVTKLSDDDSDFGALGLGAINDESERISVPVSVRLNAVF